MVPSKMKKRVRAIHYRGLKTGPLSNFRAVLLQWLDIMEQYKWLKKKGKDRDAPWWYNERTSLSFFAGAIWRCGGWASEEYTTDKHVFRKGKKKRLGRGDIYFGLGRGEYLAEAKQYWPSMHSIALKRQKKQMNDLLINACDDASQVPHYGARRLGIVFASPCLPFSKKREVAQCIKGWLEEIDNIKGPIAVAWTFPEAANPLVDEDKYLYPGAVIAIRERSR